MRARGLGRRSLGSGFQRSLKCSSAIRRAEPLAQRTVDLIRQYDMVDHVTVTSFQYLRLAETRAYAPELPAGWLVREVSDATIAQARKLGLTQICPRANTVTPTLVRRLHAEGFVVRAWGVADEALMRQVVDAGADGMTVNFPDTLLAYVQGLSQ
jgi:glycerophosphoryl diester phosphodiesterase